MKLLPRKENEKDDDFSSLNIRRCHAMKYINSKVWRYVSGVSLIFNNVGEGIFNSIN